MMIPPLTVEEVDRVVHLIRDYLSGDPVAHPVFLRGDGVQEGSVRLLLRKDYDHRGSLAGALIKVVGKKHFEDRPLHRVTSAWSPREWRRPATYGSLLDTEESIRFEGGPVREMGRCLIFEEPFYLTHLLPTTFLHGKVQWAFGQAVAMMMAHRRELEEEERALAEASEGDSGDERGDSGDGPVQGGGDAVAGEDD